MRNWPTPRKNVVPTLLAVPLSGFSLHADVGVAANARRQLEHLCRYVARPPVAMERLSLLEDGRVMYRLRHRWRDGATHVIFEPLELVEELAGLVPPPRSNLVSYMGFLRRRQLGDLRSRHPMGRQPLALITPAAVEESEDR